MIDLGKYSRIDGEVFRDDVTIIAHPDVALGEAEVLNCDFRGHVKHSPNVRFRQCHFMAGHEEIGGDGNADRRVRDD